MSKEKHQDFLRKYHLPPFCPTEESQVFNRVVFEKKGKKPSEIIEERAREILEEKLGNRMFFDKLDEEYRYYQNEAFRKSLMEYLDENNK